MKIIDQLFFEKDNRVGDDYSNYKINQFVSVGSRFENCKFENIQIRSAQFGSGGMYSEYINCSFNGSHIDANSAPGYAKFIGCSFQDVKLTHFKCIAVDIINCVFSGTIETSYFFGEVPSYDVLENHKVNEIRGNDFSNAILVDTDFRAGVDLTLQKLPTGDNYLYIKDGTRVITETKEDISKWEQSEIKKGALAILGSIENDLRAGQKQLFININDFPKKYLSIVEKVFKVIATHN